MSPYGEIGEKEGSEQSQGCHDISGMFFPVMFF